MVDVVVTGIGLLSSLGSLTSSWQKLLEGKSGIRWHQPFPELPSYPLGLIGDRPIYLSSLTELLVQAALKDAGLASPLPDCGVVVGSSRGCQGNWEDWLVEDNDRTKLDWQDILPHQGAVSIARYLGTTAPVLAPMAACATGIWAIARGFELIQTGCCRRVIVGAIEAPVTRLTLAGFDKMGALAKTGCYPFDKRREGLVLGEGGAILVLETAELAKERKADIYGRILGFGLACDAYHLSAPEPSGKMAIIAIKQCLERSRLSFSDIDYIHAHGTSTQLNDSQEAKIIKYLFPLQVAVSSTKGATGHTLGASGALGVALSLMALKYQQLPPCVGLTESAFDLNLVRESYQQNIQGVLCFSFGFGGQNAVLALGNV
ncbi:MAG: beta-ketoacyl-ACP synthase [Xenococcaceae cyanobacterium MO_188.B32]|nr:beta-ketoacyl-ACP synthase [Xenococcaceae cyanobacterium MO_188.B32]